ncbi:hypothetical protein ACRRTK_016991 [Alexandromys fortis]
MLAAVGSLVAAIWAGLHLWTLLLALVTFLFLSDYFKSRRNKNYPPGPPRLPFIGNLLQFSMEQQHLVVQQRFSFQIDCGGFVLFGLHAVGIYMAGLHFARLRGMNTTTSNYWNMFQLVKKYGNVISMDFGIMSSVIVSSLPLIKEAFTHLEENLMSRPKFPFQKLVFNENGQPFDPHFKIKNAVSNIICSITFGERFEYHDSQFQELLRLLDKTIYLSFSKMIRLYNIFPWIMKHLPGSHQTALASWRQLKSYISDIVENHHRDWNPDEPRDFIDAFLTEMTKHPDKTTTSFNKENLICSTLDLFLAGTETTSTTLRWALLYMALYPEIQAKVQSEIDRVIGQEKQPSLNDRDAMPYTNAVVHEVQRMANVVPLNVAREVTVDTTLAGFHLPKESGRTEIFRFVDLSPEFMQERWEEACALGSPQFATLNLADHYLNSGTQDISVQKTTTSRGEQFALGAEQLYTPPGGIFFTGWGPLRGEILEGKLSCCLR